MKPWHWDDGRQRADWYKVGRCRQGVVLFIVCQSGVSLYVEINYVVVLNVLYQASVFGNIFCVLREEALRSLICWYLASGWRQGAVCANLPTSQQHSPLLPCLPLFDMNYLQRNYLKLSLITIHQIPTDSLSIYSVDTHSDSAEDVEERSDRRLSWIYYH